MRPNAANRVYRAARRRRFIFRNRATVFVCAILALALFTAIAGARMRLAGLPQEPADKRGAVHAGQAVSGDRAPSLTSPEAGIVPGAMVQRDMVTKQTRRVRGRVVVPGARNPREAAEGFLRTYGKRLQLSATLNELRAKREVTSLTRAHFTYEQVYGGFPVEGGRISIHVGRDLAVEVVNSDLVLIGKAVAIAPHVNQAAAVRAAVLHIGAASGSKAPPVAEPVVFVEGGTPVAAWRVTFQTRTPPADWVVVVEPRTNRILSARNRAKYDTGVGMVFDPNAVVSSGIHNLTDNSDADSSTLTSQRISVTLLGLDATGYLQGEYCTTEPTVGQTRAFSSAHTYEYTRSDNRFEEVMCYYHIDTIERYIQSLGFQNINNHPMKVDVNGTTDDNSFFSPGSDEVTFGTGGVDDAEDADIIYHEMGHAIQDNQVEDFGNSAEGGAMGEGFGDYWAGTHSAGMGPQGAAWSPYVGEWDAVSYNPGNPAYLRVLNSTKHYPEDTTGEVHDDGEIWSACLWQVRSLVGKTRADTMILESHFSLSPESAFVDGALAILDANQSLYGGADQNAIKQIFIDRGILDVVSGPSNLQAALNGELAADLTWTDNSDNEAGFRIERKIGGGAFSEIAVVGVDETTYADTGLSSGTVYTYRVRAYNGDGNSRYSNSATVTTSIPTFAITGTVTKGGTGLSGTQIDASAAGTFFHEQSISPGASIPDNNTTGVESTLAVTQTGTLNGVKVGVNITHTWIGDLEVSVVHPDGTTVILHDRSGGSTDNLVTVYPDQTEPAQSLSVLDGKPMNGTWKLKVRDLAAEDVGTLNLWSVTLKFSGTVTRTTTSGGGGAYALGGLQAGTYTVVAAMTGETFTPASRSVTVGPDQSGMDFLAIAPAVSALELSPTSVVGGQASTGTVTLDTAAGSGGTTVALSSNKTEASVPTSVVVPAGQTQATFAVSSVDVSAQVIAAISASAGGVTRQANLTVKRNDISSLALSPTSVYGGSISTGTVVLTGPAPDGGKVVILASDNASATVPASVTVPSGQSSATFTIGTSNPSADLIANISGTLNLTKTKPLSIKRLKAASLALSPSSVWAGKTSTATVNLNSAAPAEGMVVTLTSSSLHATVPADVTVLAGKTKATFTIATSGAAPNVTATISATAGGATVNALLTIKRIDLSTLVLNPTSLTGGGSTTGSVTLNGPAPSGGAVVPLSSNNAAATVPAFVTVPEGETARSFTVTTTAVSENVAATISATLNLTRSKALTIRTPALSSLAISPNSVWGGISSTGTVTLNSLAPAGGFVVTLSVNKSEVTVPASVTVPQGQTQQTFVATTIAVSANLSATITGVSGGVTKTGTLTVKSHLVKTVGLTPATVTGGASSTGKVTLTAAAGTGGVVVNLTSDKPDATLPASVTVLAGQTEATFTVNTTTVAAKVKATIKGAVGVSNKSGVLTINP